MSLQNTQARRNVKQMLRGVVQSSVRRLQSRVRLGMKRIVGLISKEQREEGSGMENLNLLAAVSTLEGLAAM